MSRLVTAFAAGLVFGLGLLLSGMANPEKVLGFLDLAGDWDPSLALVMAGAIATALPIMRWAGAREYSLLGAAMTLPTRTDIDKRMVLGGLAFGAGWGLAGFCPGPAMVALAAAEAKAVLFVAAMLLGMGLFELLERRRTA